MTMLDSAAVVQAISGKRKPRRWLKRLLEQIRQHEIIGTEWQGRLENNIYNN